jgi:uncharacterized protein YbjT (DUF2867 family)
MNQKPTIVMMGATGAVGSHVVAEILRNPAFAHVTSLGRRLPDPASADSRLRSHVVDLFDTDTYDSLVAGHDTAICTLGVGQPSKSARSAVWAIDVDCVVRFAQVCRRHNVRQFSLLTSAGTNKHSILDYLKMKGTVEEAVAAHHFERCSFFRPSMLITPENRYGPSSALALALAPRLDPFLFGSLRKFRSLTVEELGRAMARHALSQGRGVEILHWDAIRWIK